MDHHKSSTERIQRIKRLIQQGRYETPERYERAITNLIKSGDLTKPPKS